LELLHVTICCGSYLICGFRAISLLEALCNDICLYLRTTIIQPIFPSTKPTRGSKCRLAIRFGKDRIKQDVDAQLSAKGWTKVDSNGNATISAFQSTHDQQTLETFYNGFGGGWRWRGFGDGMATTTTDVTKIGTLVVDIFDSQTQKLIWRGKQSDALSGNPNKNEKKLAKDITGMFKHFPPSH
jgi:hypothetical protein